MEFFPDSLIEIISSLIDGSTHISWASENFVTKGPHQLLLAGSRAAGGKMARDGNTDCLKGVVIL